MRNRAYRRHERDKAIARAICRAKQNLHRTETIDDTSGWVRRSAVTPVPCSGPCCGNPRRWFTGDEGLTMAERRRDEADRDDYSGLR